MHQNIHIYQSSFRHESRMLKITQSLVDAGVFSQIDILAAWEEGQETFEPIDAQRRVRRLKTRLGRRDGGKIGKLAWVAEWLVRTTVQTLRLRPACINCHSLLVLPIGVIAKWLIGSRLIYDTHELETETGNCRGLRQRILKLVERCCIHHVDETIVVGQAIANWYQETYSLPMVHVARNVPHRATLERLRTAGELSRSCSPLRTNLNIAEGDLIYLYQGLIDEGRGIELMLDTFTKLPADRHLVLMGYGGLVPMVQQFAADHSNIHYHEAVAQDVLPSYTIGADVGLALIENICLSYYYCVPNKLFEYLTCGLPVIVSDFPEMGAIVDQYHCGWRSELTVAGLRRVIERLDGNQIVGRRIAALKAGEAFCWEKEAERMLVAYRKPPVGESFNREAA